MNDALTLAVTWPGMTTGETRSEGNGRPHVLSYLRTAARGRISIIFGRTATAGVHASEEFSTPPETATALSGMPAEMGQPVSMEEACAAALGVADEAELRRLAFFEKEARAGVIWEDEE